MEENKLKTINYSLHPQTVDTETRKEIFGEMEYIDSKPRYYSSIFEISREVGEQLKQIAKNQEVINKEESYILRDLLKQVNIIGSQQLDCKWEDYIKQTEQQNVKEFRKAELLKIDEKEVKRDSVIIDKFENIESKLHTLNTLVKPGQDSKLIESLTEKVAHLFKRDAYNKDKLSNLTDDIEAIEIQLAGLISVEHGNNV